MTHQQPKRKTSSATNHDVSRRRFLGRSLATGAGAMALCQTRSGVPQAAEAVAGKQGPEPEILLERVEKIFSDGRWNGRAGLVFWKDRYYMTFRSGSEHSSTDGKIRLLTSRPHEPRGWTVSDVVDTPHDDAEAHLMVTPDRLFVYFPLEDAKNTGDPIRTMLSQSPDGQSWSPAIPVYKPGFSFWKTTTHKGTYYAAADIMTGNRRVELVRSTDGLDWEKVSTILEGRFTETSLLFLNDDSLLAFTRQGKVSFSRPPYTQWETQAGVPLGGPAAALIGNTILVSGRTSTESYPDDQPGSSRTGLFTFDPVTKTFRHRMNMLTQWGLDESYPHFLRLDDHRALMVWYTGEGYERGVAKQADLLLAHLRIQ